MLNPKLFGSTPNTGFNIQQNTTPGFGTTNTGFGGVGTPTTVFGATNPGFGGVGTTSTGFGTSNTGFGGIGQTNTGFGAPSTSTSLFGAQQQQQTTPFFGSQQTTQTAPFGSASTGVSPFGGTSTSLFGGTNTAQTNSQSLFGQRSFSGTTPFGGTTGTNTMQQPVGTTIKFNPLIGSDTMLKNNINTTISTRHQCITAMKEYEGKSMEELRWEDYQANRKGPQQGTPTAAFGTGAGSSLFTSTQPAVAPFNAGTNSFFCKPNFGTTTTATTSIFNTASFGKPPFGGNSTAPSFGTVGAQQQQPATATSGSLFNPTSSFTPGTNFFQPSTSAATTQSKSIFGTPTTSTPSIFGQANTAAAPKTGFGVPSTGSTTFGSNPFASTTNTFSFNPTTTTASLFSSNLTANTAAANTMNKQPSLFNFSSNPMSNQTFSAPNPTMTNFNSGNLFNTPSTNFFGAQNTSSSLFSNPIQPGQPQVPPMSLQQSLSQNIPASELLLNRLQHMPYGDSPLFQNNITANQSQPIKFSTDSKTLYQYKVSHKTTNAPKVPRSLGSSQINTSFLFDGLDDDKPEEEKSALDIFAPRRNIKRLVLKPKDSTLNASATESPSLSLAQRPISNESKENVAESTVNELFSDKQSAAKSPQLETTITSEKSSSFLGGVGDGDESSFVCPSTPPPPLKCGVKLTKSDYYTIPPYNELDKYYDPATDTCKVPSLTVGREGYGEICWEDPLDIKGLNLDEIVHIRRKEVIVYPDDDSKPPVGQGLNRPAQVTLHQVWPVDKTTHDIIKDIDRLRSMKYAEKIEAATNKLGAIFKDYRPDTGSWVFCVKHFSKYGLVDDDDDIATENKEQIPPKTSTNTTVGVASGRLVLQKPIHVSQTTQTKDMVAFDTAEMPIETGFVDFSAIQEKTDLTLSQISHIHGAGELSDELKDISEEKVPEIFSSYYDPMRFALFSEEDESDQIVQSHFKRPKRNTYSIEDRRQIKPMLEPLTSYVPKVSFVKKRDLLFEPDTFASNSQLVYDISSVCHTLGPKVRFFNGSSNFTLIKGNSVVIHNLDLISDISAHYARFETQLKDNSTIFSQKNEPPFIETKPVVHNKYNIPHLEKLVEAFFGELAETTSYGRQHERLNRVIDWLSERNKLLKKPKDITSRILHCMCCNDLKNAVDEALSGKMPKLALLISSGNNLNVKSSLIKQLESWRKSGADAAINKDLIKIYIVLSGGIKWVTSLGDEIDVLDGLTWTQQLALMLIFSTHEGLADCIDNLTVETNDVEYHILARHTPWHAIDAASNYLEGWFLHQSLKSYKVIEDDYRSDLIHMIMWSQLVSRDALLACFVACHIKDDFLRNKAVSEAIIAYAPKLKAQDDSLLVSSLSIPKPLLARLKAIYYKNIFDHEKYAFNLLDGEEWSKAHDAFVEEIFPELVIYQDQASLRSIIDRLKPHRESIPNWYSNGANVYDIYSQALISQSDANLNEFNVHLLKCANGRQTLCQSEMARKINYILVTLRGDLYQLNTPIPPDYALKELNYNYRKLVNLISQ